MSKHIGKNLKIALILILINVLVTSSVIYAYSPSFKTYLGKGSMVETATYILFKDAGICYAKNGLTGAIDYSGTNGSQIFQNAIDVLMDEGGIIFVKRGSYTANITMKRNIRLIGENQRYTIIYGTISFLQIKQPTIVWPSSIEHLQVDAKTVGLDYGVYINGSMGGIRFEDMRVMGTVADFYINASDLFSCNWIDVSTHYGGTYAFYVNGYLDQCRFERVWVGYQDYGLYLHDNYNEGGYRSRILSSVFYAFDTAGITKAVLHLRGEVAYNTFENCRWGDIFTSEAYVYLNGTNVASTSEYAGNVFRECKLWAGETETVYIGRNWNYTTFIDCSAFCYFNISSFAHRTSFDTISPYRTPLFDRNPTYFDEGTNTRISYSWNGTNWIDTYP